MPMRMDRWCVVDISEPDEDEELADFNSGLGSGSATSRSGSRSILRWDEYSEAFRIEIGKASSRRARAINSATLAPVGTSTPRTTVLRR
eukprot:scaffold301185_cov33-Tisochrysis_lutea.AAC.2